MKRFDTMSAMFTTYMTKRKQPVLLFLSEIINVGKQPFLVNPLCNFFGP